MEALVVVLDVSSSGAVPDAPWRPQQALLARRCQELAGRLEERWRAAGGERIEYLVLTTGDAASNQDPRELLGWSAIADQRQAALFQGYDPMARRRRLTELVQKVQQQCQQKIRPTRESPIHRALLRAADAVRDHCRVLAERQELCRRQVVALHSDMLEGTEKRLMERMMKPGRKVRDQEGLRLALGDVDVLVCGVSQTHGDGRVRQVVPQDLLGAWRPIFGRDVTFAPLCPLPDGSAREQRAEVAP